MSRLDGFDKNLEEAAMDLGENAWGTFKRVTFPLVLPGIVSSLLLAFVISFDEFVLAFFLTGTEVTLPVAMYSRLRFPLQLPPVLAMASFIIIISFVVVIVAELFRRKGQKTEKIDLF
jgi:spermidine/putrescine transport system permease protein